MDGQIVVIGNFDGVHRGHQAVLADAATRARAERVACAVLTFSPHPAVVLGRTPPPLLTTLERKVELVGRAAPDVRVVVMPFDRPFAAQSPRAFAERVLVGRLAAREVVVGKNFRFGAGRAGDFDELTRLGAELGFGTSSHALLGDADGPWSSTRIRAAIAAGDVEEAARMLGRPHMLSGVVAEGDRRGRTIGFPTANLGDVPEELPANGVYAVLVDEVAGGTARALAKGVANVGVRPTVKEAQPRPNVEVHLFDFDRDLYGARLRVHLAARLRGEQRFAGLVALKAQIAKDAGAARARLADAAPRADGAFG
ncbi:MAG TPA: bifunctional riboflavin kinase/FAD synthetase [Minicystis sp.]|nr:bifunctional riboflavin kinase/FAD synthetase [Minicystis sp.]